MLKFYKAATGVKALAGWYKDQRGMLVIRHARVSAQRVGHPSFQLAMCVGRTRWIPATSYPARCAGDALGDNTREHLHPPQVRCDVADAGFAKVW